MDTDKRTGVWPELAEYNCLACHQPVAQAGKLPLRESIGRAPGVPPWQSWNFECLPIRSAEFDVAINRLRSEMERSFMPLAADVARLTTEARAALLTEVQQSGSAALFAAVADRGSPFTWDRACHELAALAAAERGLQDRGAGYGLQTIEKIGRIGQALAFSDESYEWPAVFDKSLAGKSRPVDTLTLDEVSAELNALADELQKRARSTEY